MVYIYWKDDRVGGWSGDCGMGAVYLSYLFLVVNFNVKKRKKNHKIFTLPYRKKLTEKLDCMCLAVFIDCRGLGLLKEVLFQHAT